MLLDALFAPFRALHTMRQLGGPIVDWIFATCVVMWCIVIERFWYFNRILPRLTADSLQIWRSRGEHTSWSARQVRKAISTEFFEEMRPGGRQRGGLLGLGGGFACLGLQRGGRW